MSDRNIRGKRIAYELIEQSHNQFKKTQRTRNEKVFQILENKSEKIFEPSQRFYAVFGRVIGKDKDSDQSRKILTPQKKEEAFNVSPAEGDFPAKESCNEEPSSNVSVFEKLSSHRSKIESSPKRKNSKNFRRGLR